MNQHTKLLVMVGLALTLLVGCAKAPQALTWQEVAAELARLQDEMRRDARLLREQHPVKVPESEKEAFYAQVDAKDQQLTVLKIDAAKQHGAAPVDISQNLKMPLIVEARQAMRTNTKQLVAERIAQARSQPRKMPLQPIPGNNPVAKLEIPAEQLADAANIRARVRQRTTKPENPLADEALTSVQRMTLESMNRVAYELETRRWSSEDHIQFRNQVALAERTFEEAGQKEILRRQEVAERERLAALRGEAHRKQVAEIDARAKLEQEKNAPLPRLPGEDDVDYLRRVSIENLKRLQNGK